MKASTKPLLVSLAVVVSVFLVNERYAQAGAGVATPIAVDENGNGSINFGGGPIPLAFTLAPDPGPAGLPLALTYSLPFPGVIGDVLLFEPVTQQVSDWIRFNGNGTLVFYSDVPEGGEVPDLADVGFPGLSYEGNLVVIPEIGPEGNNGATYTPLPGQPGYDPAVLPRYTFISDIPEPGTMTLVGMGVVGLLAISRRKK